ncbi:MAG: M20/M25/M40 family metallo-hydrolase [Proteobacteria bacterium]|nr:M20/M25/M40 family metallo-hydrolase [Pseudomonadota bacterium]
MRLSSMSLFVLALLAVGTAYAAPSAVEKRIAAAVERRMDAALELLAETVNVSSATENLTGVRAVGEIYAREFRALGFETRWVDVPAEMKRAGHLVATHRGKRGGPRLLLIGHLDTVLQGEPFRRDGNRAYGSGSSDMKGGNLVALEALRALQATGELRDMNVTVVFTGDEEDPGSPQLVTRESLLAAAAESDIALAFEGSAPGKGVIGRRGIGSWRLHVTGMQGHSSGVFGEVRGYGAVFEAARILDQFRTELRESNLTYNPSVIVGGTNVSYDTATKSGTALGKTNVIPREVRVEGDLRYLGAAQFESARTKMQAIVAANLPQTSAEIVVDNEYPSMAPNPGSERILGVLDSVSRDLGAGPVVAQPPIERGAGDIAFVCGDGRLACLDGLGTDGENDHAPGEYVLVDSLPLQVKRAAILMHRLAR